MKIPQNPFNDALQTCLNTGIFDLSLKLCPDNRVRHLVLHAKKKRTRKKNLHRIFRMLEKEKIYE